MRKKYDPEKIIKTHTEEIPREIRHWKALKEFGCNDPFWPDGMNMNLTRNHIIYAKTEIMRICTEENIPVPEEYYLPTPPVVDDSYMASLKDPRTEKLRQYESALTHRKISYNENQTELV